MNNPTILDIALGFILHKHSKDKFGRRNNKAQAIREMSDEELEMGAERFALSRGGRSPRCAKQYVESLFC